VAYLIVSFLVAFFAATYVTWTFGRLQRLHDRCAAARASLDAQLVRRAAAAAALGRDHNGALGDRAGLLSSAAEAALRAAEDGREVAENDLTRELRHLPWSGAEPAMADVVEAAARMTLARHIYNDAVRDTLALRWRRVPRALRLGASRPAPRYFDIDDTPPGRP
jgi:hypothetical protein